MSNGNGIWKTVAGWVASILLGAAGLAYGIGGAQGRADVRAVEAKVEAQKERVDELRGDVQAAAKAAHEAAAETRQARQAVEDVLREHRVMRTRTAVREPAGR